MTITELTTEQKREAIRNAGVRNQDVLEQILNSRNYQGKGLLHMTPEEIDALYNEIFG